MKEIKVLLLQGGMEVIAEVEPLHGISLTIGGKGPLEGYRLTRPFRVLPVPLVGQNAQGIQINVAPQLVPLLGAVINTSIEIDLGDIIGQPMEANKQFESAYVRMTTGLQLAG